MPGGKRNPFSISRLVEAVDHAKSNAHEVAEATKALSKANIGEIPFVDLEIQFIGASGLPKLDVVGSCDPYFVANIDEKISYVSAVKPQTLSPVWNEVWRIKNVPSHADLHVEVLDKDDGAPHDDYVGKFKCSVSPGAKECEIEGPVLRINRNRGTFWLKITSTKTTSPDAPTYPYLFDGPLRFTRHFSPLVGRFTNLDDARLYSTWKIYLRSIPLFFGSQVQHWNKNYKAAQSIFQGPTAIAVRGGIQAGHRMLYARNANNTFGVLESGGGLRELLRGGVGEASSGSEGKPGAVNLDDHRDQSKDGSRERSSCSGGGGGSTTHTHTERSSEQETNRLESRERKKRYADRIKPAVYTYIISSEDSSLRFSETGAAFFVDFASKHALHSNCSPTVVYSGEFHPRPEGGWGGFSNETRDDDVEWELVIDNNSGTYAPSKDLLPSLQKLLEYNFTGFRIHAWDREDPRLVESREACREFAVRERGVGREELQPHVKEGEEVLSHRVSIVGGGSGGGVGGAIGGIGRGVEEVGEGGVKGVGKVGKGVGGIGKGVGRGIEAVGVEVGRGVERVGERLDRVFGKGSVKQETNRLESRERKKRYADRIKPAVYSYIISSEDSSLRFSETGAAFFVDFASKHALHSNCSPTVIYSGEFHPRPEGGWGGFSNDIKDEDVDWELIIDNNSGTYAPSKSLLPSLQKLLEYNFTGFKIHAWDREDPRLVESREACREFAVRERGVGREELQPHVKEGEEVLSHRVSLPGAGLVGDGVKGVGGIGKGVGRGIEVVGVEVGRGVERVGERLDRVFGKGSVSE